jgi:hypothetical protein
MPEPSVYPVQAPGLDIEIEIQWRAMSGLARASKAPLAPSSASSATRPCSARRSS